MTDCGIKQRINEFDMKHNMDAVVINGWLLFSDGATREINPYGLLAEPPSDAFECAKRKVQYREVKLGLAVDEFNTFKNNLLIHTKTELKQRQCPAPYGAEKSVEMLKELKKKVAACQKELAKARAFEEASKPESLRQREAQYEENRKSSEAFLVEVSKINI